MSNITNNLLVNGARGNVGKQFVYRKHGKKTIIARMPQINKNAAITEKQETRRELFASAILYAQGAIESAELKKEYQKKAGPGRTAYNMALRDYLKAPVVKKIDAENYKGLPGSTIIVHAKDDFRVAAVKVQILLKATGELLEEGLAVLEPVKRDRWTYTASQSSNTVPVLIRATATDLPGNEAVLEVTV